MMAITCAGLAGLLVGLAVEYVRLWRTADRAVRREAQLIDLCTVQQRWIRRGEVACTNCPELGVCIVKDACQRERCAIEAAPAGVTAEVYLPARVHFVQE